MVLDYDEIWKDLRNEVELLHSYWQMREALFGFSEERDKLLRDSAEGLFYLLDVFLWRELCLGLCRLTETGRNKLTLQQLLKHPKVTSDRNLLTLVKQKINAAKGACDPLREHRHKVLAHLDLKTNLTGVESTFPPDPRKKIDNALHAVADALNAIGLSVYGMTFEGVRFPSGYVESLVRCLEEAQR
ncbi:MAG: hypothetical protein HYU32_02110 [candidate division NC10 bacterium]|nr:hypothetical protein [candidate division NC10 bacterium]